MVFRRVLTLAVVLVLYAIPLCSQGLLRAGAAKVDITPADPAGLRNLWETPFAGVHDRIWARALVLDDGAQMAAIVAVDTVEFGDTTALEKRIAASTGIPASNVILAATHNHNSPMMALANAGATRKGGPGAPVWIAETENDIIAAISQAKQHLQPVRMGIGTGRAYVNINRDELTPQGWKIGNNPDGPSEKTVWVVKFETLSGEPVALLANYAVHAVVMGPENNLVTGDLPGAASRFVESVFGDKLVALWTSGSAGDQNPVYMSWDTTYTNKTTEPGFDLVNTLGHMLGEEIVRVARSIKADTPAARIRSAEKIATCPGQRRDPEARQRGEVKFVDADPVSFRLRLLMVGHVALAAIPAEVGTTIYWQLRRASPFTNTILITLANGRIGYIADDPSHDLPTYEAAGSPIKKGCGPSAIVNGFVELMRQQ